MWCGRCRLGNVAGGHVLRGDEIPAGQCMVLRARFKSTRQDWLDRILVVRRIAFVELSRKYLQAAAAEWKYRDHYRRVLLAAFSVGLVV